ncbi:MAG: helix-turn-helix domain-containing protein, partial [Actinomycetota bacterium]|nr:helix-turn-helix domain-containing protein [Actinomycetota bacterium]
MARIAQRFEELLDAYPRPDGKRWRGADLVEATGGVVTRSYVSALRKGNIDSPGYDKLRAIAKAMNFPVEMWFELAFEKPAPRLEPAQNGTPFTERLDRLFEAIFDEKRGRLYTNADVARMSAGGISEERIAGIRSGE